MAIEVHIEPEGDSAKLWELERCCICREPTPYWTLLPDRIPGQQVACCRMCAKFASPEAIPTKTQWCERERVLRIVKPYQAKCA